jgi:myo-inositol catabolism protein IolC
MFGIVGDSEPEQFEAICDAKRLIFEGALEAVARGAKPEFTGIVVDEQFGCDVPARAREHGVKLAMPVERSGQREFEFEYGDEFGAHIERCDPDFSKVLVRYNPEDADPDLNARQRVRLKTLSDWLHARERKLLFELLVPPTEAQLERVGGEGARFDAELRPQLMRATIEELQNAGVEVDVWKLEGVQESADAAMLAEQTRTGSGREHVDCIVLGRAGSDEQIDHWLAVAAPVEGFVGYAIGRSIWWAALRAFLLQSLPREQARDQIASNYLRFVDVYERHEMH